MPSKSQFTKDLVYHTEEMKAQKWFKQRKICIFSSGEAGWGEGHKLEDSSGTATVVLVKMLRPAEGQGACSRKGTVCMSSIQEISMRHLATDQTQD